MLKKTAIGFGIIAVLLALAVGCVSFRESDNSMAKAMKKDGKTFDIVNTTWQNKPARYLHYKKENAPTLVFVHGTPGSSSAFLEYIKNPDLRALYNIIIIDRPGYGYTDYGHYAGIQTQVEFLEFVLKDAQTRGDIYLIGHSFGDPIVLAATMQGTKNLAGTVVLGGAIDPANEKYFWYGKLGIWKGTRWLTSKALRVAADEKYDHENQLAQNVQDFEKLKTPIFMIHGTKDKIVPFENVAFAQLKIQPDLLSVYAWPEASHFIPFNEREAFIEILLSWINTPNKDAYEAPKTP